MTNKFTSVTLHNSAADSLQDFEINHAERILRMPNNGGWQLPSDSPFTFNTKNGIGRANTKDSSGDKAEVVDNKSSDQAPE